MSTYNRIKRINYLGYGHFNHGYGYNTHADYDTNAPSIEHFLGKTNQYLHYLDHIFAEMIETISDILSRLEDFEKELDELRKYKHVPGKLDKIDESHDYITVKNENRTQADGLPIDYKDEKQQHFLLDTSKMDLTIDDLAKVKHVPAKLDKINSKKDYIVVSNENRTQEDGLEEGLLDIHQQHHLIDPSKLEEVIDGLDSSKHVPGKIDKTDNSHSYIKVENKNRSQEDGLKEGLVDNDQQHFMVDTTELDTNVDDLNNNKHVPAKLDKVDNTHDYITVKNENRSQDDGLPDGLIDKYQQHHFLDTSKIDLIIDELLQGNGTEIQIFGDATPGDGTSIEIGDISRFDEVKIYFDSLVFSVSRLVNYINTEIGSGTSFILSNIVDIVPPKGVSNGEIGQTLSKMEGTKEKASISFGNSQVWRFGNDNGKGGNNAWNNINKMQDGGSFGFSTGWFPKNPDYGDGWIHIIKINGVIYGSKSLEKGLQTIVTRLDNDDYMTFYDFNRYMVYSIASNSNLQLNVLEHLERFKDDLQDIQPCDIPASPASVKNRYDELIAYREKLRKELNSHE